MSGRKPALKDRQEWRGRWAWADPFFYWVLLGFTRFLTGSSVSLVMLPLVTNGGNRSEEANRSGEAFELREMNRFVFLLLLPGFTDFRFTGSRCRRSRSLRLRMRRKLQFVDCLVLRQWNNPRQKAKKNLTRIGPPLNFSYYCWFFRRLFGFVERWQRQVDVRELCARFFEPF